MKEVGIIKGKKVAIKEYKWTPIEYKKSYTQQLLNNQVELRRLISDGDSKMIEKVEKYAEKHMLNPEILKEKILSGDPIVTSIFVVNPGRQTFHENVAAEYIANIPIIDNFEKLPVGGPNALYIDNGVIRNTLSPTMKSIDFYWEYNFKGETLKVYATHKYTNETGGAQDNQLYDVSKSNDYAMEQLRDKDVFFYSITDGEYYSLQHTKDKTKELNKLDFLRQYEGPRNRASTSNRLTFDFANTVIDWLQMTFEDPNEYKEEVMYLKELAMIAKKSYNETEPKYI